MRKGSYSESTAILIQGSLRFHSWTRVKRSSPNNLNDWHWERTFGEKPQVTSDKVRR